MRHTSANIRRGNQTEMYQFIGGNGDLVERLVERQFPGIFGKGCD